MTSKTSESELLEQVLSSSDSHSDSLELSNRGEGKTWRKGEEVHKVVIHGDFQVTQTPKCKDSCLFFQQIFECLFCTLLSNTMKNNAACNAKSQSSRGSKPRFLQRKT